MSQHSPTDSEVNTDFDVKKSRRVRNRSFILLATVVATAAALASWKQHSLDAADAAGANQPEPMELVSMASAAAYDHRPTTTAIGTVLALHSITVSNEVPGTVDKVMLHPGEIVEAGSVLIAFNVAVEQAELNAQKARARLADTRLERVQRLHGDRAVSLDEVDRAMAERDVAHADVERLQAIIDRKTIRAPFRARVGITDIHRGQYLETGTKLTTLQSINEAVHVDFSVAQQVAAQLQKGERIEVHTTDARVLDARIVAVDARIDATTRNATVRARIDKTEQAPAPGSSVKVQVPVGDTRTLVRVPISALRKGPEGDHDLPPKKWTPRKGE